MDIKSEFINFRGCPILFHSASVKNGRNLILTFVQGIVYYVSVREILPCTMITTLVCATSWIHPWTYTG